MERAYDLYHEHCIYRGWNKYDEETELGFWMCSMPQGKPAQGWDEWVKCEECNCFILKGGK